MATAIIGIGNIGGTLARHLVRGGEPVVLAAKDEANAAALAQELGELARAPPRSKRRSRRPTPSSSLSGSTRSRS
jgi:predicted dinucleotide-binding enzyme